MVVSIILSFGHHELTIACLESLTRLSRPLDTIIVCDNNSALQVRQEILAWATEQFGEEQVTLLEHGYEDSLVRQTGFVFIQNKDNGGFARGNNPGIRYALACDADFIWLLNNDTTVDSAALTYLLSSARKNRVGISGSTVVYADDRNTIQCAGGCTYNPATTIFKEVFAGEPLSRAITESGQPPLDYIYGASLFVRADVFEKCGLLNEEYFLFYEEIDFCMRAKQKGFLLHWCRQAIVYHRGSYTVGRADSGDKRKIAFANYHENLSTLIFSRKFYPFLLPFILVFRFFGKLAVLAKRGEWYLLEPLFTAYRDFFIGQTLKKKISNVEGKTL